MAYNAEKTVFVFRTAFGAWVQFRVQSRLSQLYEEFNKIISDLWPSFLRCM